MAQGCGGITMEVVDKRTKKMMTGMLEMWFVTGTTIFMKNQIMD